MVKRYAATTRLQALSARLDTFVWMKRGYSIWKHLLPFSVASGLLLVVSMPTDNLLLQLAAKLQTVNWIWLPAALLTVVTTVVYIVTMYAQIQASYLWSEHDLRRALLTAALYIFLCVLMAYGVLRAALIRDLTAGDIWGCALLSMLSLTGIGWSGPDKWAEAIGVKMPDYSKGHQAITRLTAVLGRIRNQERGESKDVEDFLGAAGALHTNIAENLDLEPAWARAYLEQADAALRHLIRHAETDGSSTR
jgi:hypothetical protein